MTPEELLARIKDLEIDLNEVGRAIRKADAEQADRFQRRDRIKADIAEAERQLRRTEQS